MSNANPRITPDTDNTAEEASNFQLAAEEGRVSIAREFWDFLKYNKKWWLLPILISFVLLGGLLIMANVSSVAPFIYTLF